MIRVQKRQSRCLKWGRLPYRRACCCALKSSNLYLRKNAADALAAMKPLPPDAVHTLVTALKDKNSDVRNSAIDALEKVGGEAQRAAEAAEKRDQQAKTETPKPDTRIYSRKQIIARIPADDEYRYPLTLVYLVPITKGAAAEARLFVSVHAGKDRPDRLVIWSKVGHDQYQQNQIMYSEEDYVGLGLHYERPFTFDAKYQYTSDKEAMQRGRFFLRRTDKGMAIPGRQYLRRGGRTGNTREDRFPIRKSGRWKRFSRRKT